MKNFLIGLIVVVVLSSALVVIVQNTNKSVVTGSPISQSYGNATTTVATGTTVATTTIVGSPGRTIYVTDISGGSDSTTSIIKVVDGSTVIWQATLGGSAYNHTFATPLRSTAGNSVSVVISGSTAVSNVDADGTYTP